MRDVLFLLGPTPETNRAKVWYERDHGDARLSSDRKLLGITFPTLRYGLNYRTKTALLTGPLTLRADCGVPTEILIRLEFPPNYPELEPVVYDRSGLFEHVADRHFSGDLCCLWLPPESEWKGKDPRAIYDYLCHVSIFFERQLIFDASGGKTWPWGERDHYVKGYLEYIAEELGDKGLIEVFSPYLIGGHPFPLGEKCPCGGGRRFKSCHFKIIEKLSSKISGGVLQRVLHESTEVATGANA